MNKINDGAVAAAASSSSSPSILPSTSNEVGERALGLGNNNTDTNIRPPPIILPSNAPLLPRPLINSIGISREINNIIITSSSNGLDVGVGGGGNGIITNNGEKTIPFLRQLTQMLRNNTELISFIPGKLASSKTTTSSVVLGQIVVHDRRRVQNEVLPIYFNHASFASLRRQLSYFSFVRVGKGRQQAGVIYTNENVVELEDICKLRRRRSGGVAGRASSASGVSGSTARDIAELAEGGVGIKREGEEEETEQELGGERQIDGINVDHIAFPSKVVTSGDQKIVFPPGRVNDSNNDDDDRIASAMMSGALHAASDNCHSNKRAILAAPVAAAAASGNNSSKRTTATAIHSSFFRGGSSGDEDDDDDNYDDDDDDVSYPPPPSPPSSSNQNVCGSQQQPLTKRSIMQKKKTMMVQVHHPHNPFIHQHRHHPNWRRLPMALTSSSPSSNAVNNNSSSNSGVSNSSSDTTITNTNCNLGNTPINKNNSSSNNNNSQSHCCSRVVLPMKDRTRFDRLLSINSIVPFIHLPAPASTAKSSLMNSASFTTSVEKGVVKKGGGGGLKLKRIAMKDQEQDKYDDEDITAPSPPKRSKVATSIAPVANSRSNRERSSSDCVITALLALGADRQ